MLSNLVSSSDEMTTSDTSSSPNTSVESEQHQQINTGIAGLQPISSKKVNKPLTNFGFIPRKKARDSTGDISAQIQNLILDSEQSTPIVCVVPENVGSDVLVEKELNHNPKNILGRKRVVSNNAMNSKREYTNEQSTVTMVRTVIETYPNIFKLPLPFRRN